MKKLSIFLFCLIICISLVSCGKEQNENTAVNNFRIEYIGVGEGNLELPIEIESIKTESSINEYKENETKILTVDEKEYSAQYKETYSNGFYNEQVDIYRDPKGSFGFRLYSDGTVKGIITGITSEKDYMTNLLSDEEYKEIAKQKVYELFDKEKIGDDIRLVQGFNEYNSYILFKFFKKIGDFEYCAVSIYLNNKGEIESVNSNHKSLEDVKNISVSKRECDEYVLEELKKVFKDYPEYQFDISSCVPGKLEDGSEVIKYYVDVTTPKYSELISLLLYI